MGLSERKKQILFKSVEDYIQSALPITSLSVHKRHLKNVSTATLRNELSALEAMGYLKQIHTSSGRVPTTLAYRLYVDEIMSENRFDIKQLGVIKNIFTQRTGLLTEIINNIAKTISEVTNYPTIVLLNGFDKLIIKNIKLVPLVDNTLLLLIATNAGVVNNNVSVDGFVTEKNCLDASNYLTKKFENSSIKDMIVNMKKMQNEINNEIKDYENIFECLLNGIISLAERENREFSIKGTVKLLENPEYNTLENAKGILDVLENEEKLASIFENSGDEDITITIGEENFNKELNSCSVVKANYSINGENIAQIGVIGPQRMDYSKIAGALKFIVDEAKNLNKLNDKED